MDLASQSLFTGYALPGILVVCLMYLFWFKGFLALVGAAGAFHYMDLSSQSTFEGVLLPVFFGICLIYFSWWLLLVNFVSVAVGTSSGSESNGIGGGFDGGDGGGD